MGDEEFGRRWAALKGTAPRAGPAPFGEPGGWWWHGEQFFGPPDNQVPEPVWNWMFGDTECPRGRIYYATEGEAYAHLGLAVRRVHAAVPTVPES